MNTAVEPETPICPNCCPDCQEGRHSMHLYTYVDSQGQEHHCACPPCNQKLDDRLRRKWRKANSISGYDEVN